MRSRKPGPSLVRLRHEAAAHERAGRTSEAIASWRRVLEAAPQPRADVANRIGDLYDRAGRPRKAVEFWVVAARRYRGDGFLHKAVALWRKASRRAPADAGILLEIADLHAQLGYESEARRLYVDVAEKSVGRDDRRALAALEKLVRLEEDPRARRALAKLCEKLGKPARAAEHYAVVARSLSADGRPQEARQVLEHALGLAPANRAVKEALSQEYLRAEDWERATPLLEDLARSGDAAAVGRLARCHERAARIADARRCWQRLGKLRPHDLEPRARLALLRAREGDADQALAELSPLLDGLQERDDDAGAAALLEELVAHAGTHVPSLLRLAAVYNTSGERPALARTYDRIVEAHRERGDADLERAAAQIRASLSAPRSAPRAAAPAAPAAASSPEPDLERRLDAAAELLRSATALLIAAGSELNTDFGWPDVRSPDSFAAAFPQQARLGFGFEDLARPERFALDPALAWGFYGQRLAAARAREPHAGLGILGRWRARAPAGGYVVTSCVEGEFERAGFDPRRVVECCGSIEWFQCSRECGAAAFSAKEHAVRLAADGPRAQEPYPACPECGAIARPNVLLLGDWAWDMSRVNAQDEELRAWLPRRAGLVVIECGDTPRQPALRFYVRRLVAEKRAPIIGIGARAAEVPAGGVTLPLGPRAALELLDERLRA